MLELFIISQFWDRPSFTLTLRTGEFIGSKTAGFPFILVAKEDQTIYSPECIPKGFSLSDPDHLLGSGIISLYQHWLEHQKKGLAPFIVLNLSPLHGPTFKKSNLKNENHKLKKNLSEKKRKAEDELDVDSPTKFQKRGPFVKPGQATTKTKEDKIRR